jgi:phosphatidate cytidylyltransferase
MLKLRVVTAVVLLPVLLAAVWFDEPLPWLSILAAAWGALAVYEFYKGAQAKGAAPLILVGIAWTILLITSPHCPSAYAAPVLLTSAVVLLPVALLFRQRKEGAFLDWAWTLAGILYIGWLLSHYVSLRGLEHGREWVLFALVVTFVSDTMAYFIGRAWGRHKMAPAISPKKSWEGAAGGLAGAVIAALLLTMLPGLPLGYAAAVPLALAVSVFGQVGDLFESMYKRYSGIKDSGRWLPGHGGFLDRMDSVLFAGAVVYYYVILLG